MFQISGTLAHGITTCNNFYCFCVIRNPNIKLSISYQRTRYVNININFRTYSPKLKTLFKELTNTIAVNKIPKPWKCGINGRSSRARISHNTQLVIIVTFNFIQPEALEVSSFEKFSFKIFPYASPIHSVSNRSRNLAIEIKILLAQYANIPWRSIVRKKMANV